MTTIRTTNSRPTIASVVAPWPSQGYSRLIPDAHSGTAVQGATMMKLVVAGLALFLALGGVADAQNTSQVFGKVTDVSGGVMPGVTVTLSSPALLEPRVAVTSVTGTYEFPGLAIGMYMVRFELAGFGTQVREGLQLQGGFNAQVNVELQVASLEEHVVVTGVNPIVDIRSTTQG